MSGVVGAEVAAVAAAAPALLAEVGAQGPVMRHVDGGSTLAIALLTVGIAVVAADDGNDAGGHGVSFWVCGGGAGQAVAARRSAVASGGGAAFPTCWDTSLPLHG